MIARRRLAAKSEVQSNQFLDNKPVGRRCDASNLKEPSHDELGREKPIQKGQQREYHDPRDDAERDR